MYFQIPINEVQIGHIRASKNTTGVIKDVLCDVAKAMQEWKQAKDFITDNWPFSCTSRCPKGTIKISASRIKMKNIVLIVLFVLGEFLSNKFKLKLLTRIPELKVVKHFKLLGH